MVASQSLTTNANYIVTISRGGSESNGGLRVQANANAKLKIMIENKWVNVMEALGLSSDGGGIAGTTITAASILTGSNYLPLIATSHVWRGSSGIELSLDLRFDAWTDAVKDVVTPVETLLEMFVPTRNAAGGNLGLISSLGGLLSVPGATGGDFLQPPGPTPFSYRTKGAADPMLITVQLGQIMTITQLIPTTISWEFEDRFTQAGTPVCALVQANFISYVTPALDDIISYFMQGNGTQASATTPNTGTNSNAQSSPNASTSISEFPDALNSNAPP